MKKAKSSNQEKELPMSLGEFFCKLYDDDQYDETELETDKNETENDKGDQSAGVEETKEIPEFTIEGLQVAIDRLKKRKQDTATESESKTSKHATKRQKKS